MVRPYVTIVALGCSLLASGPVAAQGNLAGTVKRLFDASTINAITPNPANPSANVDHRPHFIVGESLKLTTREVNVAIAQQLSSFPLSSSSGGFSFSVDKDGAVVPSSTTFGPAYAERGLTIGKGKFNFGFSFQATSYDSFEGIDLDSGGMRFIREHNDCCPANASSPSSVTNFNPAFERDLLLSDLRLDIDTRTTALFANYGVTNRFDIGVAIPFSTVEMTASVDNEILRLGSTPSDTHKFDNGTAHALFAENGSATGLGDILVRSKFNFYRSETTALAAALDLRLPTGDEDNLLGTGATQAQLLFVASGEYGIFSPHVNIGYTFSNGDASEETASFELDAGTYGAVPAEVTSRQVDLSIPDEFNYVAGVSVAVVPRVTLGFDLRGRHIGDAARFELRSNSYVNRGPGALPQPTFVANDEFSVESAKDGLNVLLGVIGAKINLAGKFLLNANLLWSMSDDGLKPKPTPVIGFDYVF